MLLQNVPNPTSFEDLRCYNGILYNTFQDACVARGLLSTDDLWYNTMDEAIRIHPPVVARNIFSQILAFGEVSDPLNLL